MNRDAGSGTALLLTEGTDRTILACARSLSASGISFRICPQEQEETLPWRLTAYRDHLAPEPVASSSDTDAFLTDLRQLARQYDGVIIFPTSDGMIEHCYELSDHFDEGIVFPLPDESTYRRLAEKRQFTRLCERHRIPIPSEHDRFPASDDVPFVAKPSRQFDANGRRLVPELITSLRAYRRFQGSAHHDNYFYQEYVTGENYWFFVCIDDSNHITFAHKTLLQQPNGGSTIKAEPARIPQAIRSKLLSMVREIDWSGIVMFELIKRRSDGAYVAIESNPRFWGPLQLCVDNSVHFPVYLYERASDLEWSIDASTPRMDRGYLREDAYLTGAWKKLAGWGDFIRNPAETDCTFESFWWRDDTRRIYPYIVRRSFTRPIKYLIGGGQS